MKNEVDENGFFSIDSIYSDIQKLIIEKRVIEEISTRLMMEYGQGYDKTAVTRMIQFYKLFPSYEKVATLSQQLTWSHLTRAYILICSRFSLVFLLLIILK